MKSKRICRTLSAICLTMVVAFGFTIPAFAQGSEQAPAAPALTPEGNAALVDDFGGNKQLITVTTKAGNYFYIVYLKMPPAIPAVTKNITAIINATS